MSARSNESAKSARPFPNVTVPANSRPAKGPTFDILPTNISVQRSSSTRRGIRRSTQLRKVPVGGHRQTTEMDVRDNPTGYSHEDLADTGILRAFQPYVSCSPNAGYTLGVALEESRQLQCEVIPRSENRLGTVRRGVKRAQKLLQKTRGRIRVDPLAKQLERPGPNQGIFRLRASGKKSPGLPPGNAFQHDETCSEALGVLRPVTKAPHHGQMRALLRDASDFVVDGL